ncbi:MAG: carbon starvation CstA family protein [Lachnospiraceae bacterium]
MAACRTSVPCSHPFATTENPVGEIIRDSMGKRAQKLFTIFALLVLILVIASFVNVVAGTFMSDGGFGVSTAPTGNQTTAMISLLFIVLAIIYGYITNRMGIGTLPATIGGIIGIVAIVILGLNFGFVMSRTAWIVTIGIYIAVASLVPVWILLQPRDYLSSFLLYGMMLLALVGIFVAAATGRSNFNIPAFTGWNTSIGTLFPALFITVACGACSGFHSLIATGTSSKQLDNEKHAKPIAYGSMLIESALGIVALIALGMVYDKYTGGAFEARPQLSQPVSLPCSPMKTPALTTQSTPFNPGRFRICPDFSGHRNPSGPFPLLRAFPQRK